MTAIFPVSLELDPMPAASADASIGVFDSGVGGLSIAQEIARHLPNEQIVYLADTAHVPYGPRPDHDIRQLTARGIEWLYRQGCKMAVVACNTASAFSLDSLRAHYGESFPIVGLVPALKPAVLQSKSKVVAVLATPATFRGQLIKDVIDHFAQPAGVRVIPLTCLELVPLIEAGQEMSHACLTLLRQILQPVIDQGADHLVLGCTHYPFLKDAIEQLFGSQLILIDSGVAVARQTAQILIKHQLIAEHEHASGLRIACFVTGQQLEQTRQVVEHLIPSHLTWQLNSIQVYTAQKTK
ncbi:glutamate racemase [uncultured Acinetobacter sp.]|uniref:glutamate racemase n=1 Tax=uncultured Acinetobacter sp. TaxID=165433 RepID=UPI00258B7B89|nr:glutamate racemase [uncultured Acinetobacter sp.]